MRNRLRNLTITVDEAAAEWARIQAAKKDMSVSRLVGRLIEEQMKREDEYARAMEESMARKPFGKSTGKLLSREEVHDRASSRESQ